MICLTSLAQVLILLKYLHLRCIQLCLPKSPTIIAIETDVQSLAGPHQSNLSPPSTSEKAFRKTLTGSSVHFTTIYRQPIGCGRCSFKSAYSTKACVHFIQYVIIILATPRVLLCSSKAIAYHPRSRPVPSPMLFYYSSQTPGKVYY